MSAVLAKSFFDSMLATYGESIWRRSRSKTGEDERGHPLYDWTSGEDTILILEKVGDELIELYGEKGMSYAKGLMYSTSGVVPWDMIKEWEVLAVRQFTLSGSTVYLETHLRRKLASP